MHMHKCLLLLFLFSVALILFLGGFAKVKLATHVLTGEKVAIKIMDKESLGVRMVLLLLINF